MEKILIRCHHSVDWNPARSGNRTQYLNFRNFEVIIVSLKKMKSYD